MMIGLLTGRCGVIQINKSTSEKSAPIYVRMLTDACTSIHPGSCDSWLFALHSSFILISPVYDIHTYIHIHTHTHTICVPPRASLLHPPPLGKLGGAPLHPAEPILLRQGGDGAPAQGVFRTADGRLERRDKPLQDVTVLLPSEVVVVAGRGAGKRRTYLKYNDDKQWR